MENEEDDGEEGADDDDKFVELLHINLEDKDLEVALNSAVNLSEVKMVRCQILQCKLKSELI
jgi:hypothetical protein